MLNGLDLFSGIGGIGKALESWVVPIAYCEKDRYSQSVLLSRMEDGSIPVAPIWDDVTTLKWDHIGLPIDIIYGGFPCQDISSAGRGAGLDKGSRSGLFFEIIRLTEELRPSFVFLENVPAIRTKGLGRVLSEFTALGYDCRWTVISAKDVGAPHLRKRWFLLAKNSDTEAVLRSEIERSKSYGDNECSETVANAPRQLSHGNRNALRSFSKFTDSSWWKSEPDVGRVAYGIPQRVDRLRGLGNAVVPLQARTAFERLMGIE